jgi:hypothetical protein
MSEQIPSPQEFERCKTAALQHEVKQCLGRIKSAMSRGEHRTTCIKNWTTAEHVERKLRSTLEGRGFQTSIGSASSTGTEVHDISWYVKTQ